jgi:hypothetical protein
MKSSRTSSHDPLQELELLIARRADRLASTSPLRTSLNLHCWTEAEREVLGRRVAPPFLVPASETAAKECHDLAVDFSPDPQFADAG